MLKNEINNVHGESGSYLGINGNKHVKMDISIVPRSSWLSYIIFCASINNIKISQIKVCILYI